MNRSGRSPAARSARRPRRGARIPRLLAWAGSALVLVLVGAGCGGQGSSAGLTIYNGQHLPEVLRLVAAFERETGIRVVVRSDDENTLAEEIAVIERGHPRADVFLSENSPSLEYLQEQGLLAPVDSATLARVPRRESSPAGRWLGVSAQVSVIVYNPHLVDRQQLPRHVLELGSARFAGKVAFAPYDTDFQPIVTSVALRYGRSKALAWLNGLKRNAQGHTYPDDEAVQAAVNEGRIAFGLINEYYALRFRGGPTGANSAIAFWAPHDPGGVLCVAGAAVLAGARHPAAAQRFLAFLTTPAASRIVATSGVEYPLAEPALGTPVLGRPFAALAPDPVDIAQLGDGAFAVGLLRQVGLI